MSAVASQVTSLTIVCSTVYSGADQRNKHPNAASLTFVRGIHLWPVNPLHKGPVTWKMFPFDDSHHECHTPKGVLHSITQFLTNTLLSLETKQPCFIWGEETPVSGAKDPESGGWGSISNLITPSYIPTQIKLSHTIKKSVYHNRNFSISCTCALDISQGAQLDWIFYLDQNK